jgi:hypothetical protein
MRIPSFLVFLPVSFFGEPCCDVVRGSFSQAERFLSADSSVREGRRGSTEERLVPLVISPDSRSGGLRTVSAICLFDAGDKTGIADRRGCLRRTRSAAESRRTATRLDRSRHRAPTLNGIEAARRIGKVALQSKILFVSQESSADVVQEALALGALGYVVKVQAGSEMLRAGGGSSGQAISQ